MQTFIETLVKYWQKWANEWRQIIPFIL